MNVHLTRRVARHAPSCQVAGSSMSRGRPAPHSIDDSRPQDPTGERRTRESHSMGSPWSSSSLTFQTPVSTTPVYPSSPVIPKRHDCVAAAVVGRRSRPKSLC
jgi:hypothetical protein